MPYLNTSQCWISLVLHECASGSILNSNNNHLVYTVDIGYLSIAGYIFWVFVALAEYNSIMLEIVNDKYEQHA